MNSSYSLQARSPCHPPLVSKEKVKVEPMERENLKFLPCFASAWQKSMHLVAKEESTPLERAGIVERYFCAMKSS